MSQFIESTLQDATLEHLADLGGEIPHGPEIAPGEAGGNGSKGVNKWRSMNHG